ncbi:MAG: flagellar hook-associated protein FlgL [Bacteriovoracaceae bacterium]|nr:flagellar hook-associated protein FlgL [Bacteriovoracaceae bacterium]
MSRVSENSSHQSVGHSLSKAKSKLEDLQVKGSNLKNVQKPSDDPIGSTDVLLLRSRLADSDQYMKNAHMAKTSLEYTENAVSDIFDLLLRAKEIAVAQSSSIFTQESRINIAEEVKQIRSQLMSIANKRLGNRYIFSGHKSLDPAFNKEGKYQGDDGKTQIEVGKDFFVPTNLTGKEVFFVKTNSEKKFTPLKDQPLNNLPTLESEQSRELASMEENADESIPKSNDVSVFEVLENMYNALVTDNPKIIQTLLSDLDSFQEHVVRMRTKIGSLSNSIQYSEFNTDKDKVLNESQRSQIEDSDVAELFGSIQKQQSIMDATYKSSYGLLNRNLLQFIK